MAHFLIVDDDQRICQTWQGWLLNDGHTCDFAFTLDSAFNSILDSEEGIREPYDLVLLDHNLDGSNLGLGVLDAVREAGLSDWCENRVVVITASHNMAIVPEYTKRGSIGYLGYLIKPTNRVQFTATITNALLRRELYVEKKEDWEQAVKLLEDLQLLPAIEGMQREVESLRVIEAYYNQLLRDLCAAGGNEAKIADSYKKASASINNSIVSISSILPFLKPFKFTQAFWKDVEYVFYQDWIKFHALQSYLARIGNNPNAYRIKHLDGRANGHYEYRTGISYRLYFRREGGFIVLERFGNKNEQNQIIDFLANTGGGDIINETDLDLDACIILR